MPNAIGSKRKRKRLRFQFTAPRGKRIFLAGTFNNWAIYEKELLFNENSGNYECSILLPNGEYQYKFIVDDQWCADPSCKRWITNEHGTLNSILIV